MTGDAGAAHAEPVDGVFELFGRENGMLERHRCQTAEAIRMSRASPPLEP